MSLPLLLRVLRARAQLRSHDAWSGEELSAFQSRRLRELRDFAAAKSPFYADVHRGLADAPLDGLPVITKAELMQRFDDVVTDRDVRLRDVETYLHSATATDTFRGRYRVAATGGTTGRRGVFLADDAEWVTVLASYARAYDWGGLHAGLTNRVRMAVVSSRDPSHQSSIVGATVASAFLPTLRLDAAAPLEENVAALDAFKPDALIGYASILGVLADEQREGRLAIAPRAIFSASEVLTDEARKRIREAFGAEPTNVYAATETAGIASECQLGRMHRYDDLVLAEILDADGRPVADGEYGSRLVVSVLFSRTMPLIRYELSDRVRRLDGACEDARPFRLIGDVEGREEEVLELGGARIHPNVFHSLLETLPVAGWQVVDEGGGVRILLARPESPIDGVALAARVRGALAARGAAEIAVRVDLVDEIPRTRLGKAPLIRRGSEDVPVPSGGAAAT